MDPFFTSPPDGIPSVYKFKPTKIVNTKDPLDDLKCPIETRKSHIPNDPDFEMNAKVFIFCFIILCLVTLFK